MSVDNGGPAFPVVVVTMNVKEVVHSGMTLRDYFAGKALCGILAGDISNNDPKVIAENCYWYADALISERTK